MNYSNNFLKLGMYICALFFLVSSCTDDFDDLNLNPNSPDEESVTSIEPLIGHVQRHTFAPDRYSSWRGNLIMAGRAAEHFSFGFAGTWFPDGAGLDGGNAGWNDASWDQPLERNVGTYTKLDQLTSADGKFSDAGANAVAKIMKSFLIQRISDQFGDMPYSELGSASFPKYDSQEDIYTGIMADLKSAIDALESYSADNIESIAGGDIMYGGNVQSWIEAANTLRLRMALRSNNVRDNKSIIDECLGKPFIASNSSNVQLAQDPSQTDPVGNSWYSIWNTWFNSETGGTPAGWVVCETLIEQLKSNDDPRLFYYAQPIEGGTVGNKDDYQGSLVAALADTYVSASELSLPPSAMLSDANFPIIEMTYAEAELLQAEAYLLKGSTVEAQMHYTAGIQASMEQWGVSTDEMDIFLQTAAAALNSNSETALTQIGIQRWLASYTNGRESWAVMRRFKGLGIYPDKTFGNDIWASTQGTNGSDNKLPQRLVYPQSEINLNAANVQAAVGNQGADVMSTALWWAE